MTEFRRVKTRSLFLTLRKLSKLRSSVVNAFAVARSPHS